MKTKALLFYLLAGLLGGCVPIFSISPLYTEKDVVFKDELLGVWADPNDDKAVWKFERDDEAKNSYRLTVAFDDAKGLFDAHLVNLKGQLFLDIYPNEKGIEQTMEGLEEKAKDPNNVVWPLNFAFLVPVHTFVKIDSVGTVLKMRLTDDELMNKLLEQEPNAIRHIAVGDGDDRILLTASTKELQAFVLKYADKNLFAEPINLERKKAEKPKNSDSEDK